MLWYDCSLSEIINITLLARCNLFYKTKIMKLLDSNSSWKPECIMHWGACLNKRTTLTEVLSSLICRCNNRSMLHHQSHHQRKPQRRAGWRALLFIPRGDHVEPMRVSSSCSRCHGNAPPAQLLAEPCRREACLAAENPGKWLMCWVACAAGCFVTGTACDAAPAAMEATCERTECGSDHCMRTPIQFQLLGLKLVTSWIFENSITNPCAKVSCVFY